MLQLRKIGLGGGCHWCTEAVFQQLRGVTEVVQGYIASTTPNDRFSEAIIVTYNPQEISLLTLFQIHLHTHNATSAHSFRDKYRSAVYYMENEDEHAFAKAYPTLQKDFKEKIITVSLPFVTFKPSRTEITDYYNKNPNAPFCNRYISPKLALLQTKFKTHLNT